MATITDTFTRADATDLGVDWEQMSSSANFGISSNAAAPRSTFATITYHDTVLDTDDQYAEMEVGTLAASTFLGLVLAGGTLGTSAATTGGLYVMFVSGVGMNEVSIRRKTASSSTLTTLDSVTLGAAVVSGDVLRFERDSSGVMVGELNGSPIAGLSTAADTTYIGSGQRRAGLYASGTGVTGARVNSFSAGDIGGALPPAGASVKYASGGSWVATETRAAVGGSWV